MTIDLNSQVVTSEKVQSKTPCKAVALQGVCMKYCNDNRLGAAAYLSRSLLSMLLR